MACSRLLQRVTVAVGGAAAGKLYYRDFSTGLFGYDVLKTASGFLIFAEEAIVKSDELIECIRRTPPSMETIRLFDELSDTVCTVIDSAELCRNTHIDLEFVKEASHASIRMYEYLHKLNTNTILYDAIVKVEKSNSLTTDEAKRAAYTHRVEFERGGVHLSDEKRERIQQLNLHITRLGQEFVTNILEDPGHIDIFPASKAPKCIQQMSKPVVRSRDGIIKVISQRATDMKSMEHGIRVFTDNENLFSILKWCRDKELRRKAYINGYSVPKRNLEVLDDLISSRHEFAQHLGYRSFAEFSLAPTMAAASDVVDSFLLEFSDKIKGKADEEVRVLEKFGKNLEGASFRGIDAWDEAYYTNLMKEQSLGLNARVVASFFPLRHCVEGLKLITRSLFGVELKQVPAASGEIWHPGVQKFTLQHSVEGDMGHLYLDLYSRKGKFPGSAHFALKGGRRLADDKYQLPVVALVCNFSNNSSTCPLLNHWEVETLFHEFGHALHSLLTRTDYQHFSGTRTVLDFVEIPSNLFEYYAWDHRVLKGFAKHYSTGETIPFQLVELMKKAKNMFVANDLQRQVLYAMIDQAFFGEQSMAEDTTSIIAGLKHKHCSWKHVDGTHWQTRFNHLVTYGAGYYSYLYARCFAATIWDTVCDSDPLSADAGNVLRTSLLQHGGAKDPALLIKECTNDTTLMAYGTGVKPSMNCLLNELGI